MIAKKPTPKEEPADSYSELEDYRKELRIDRTALSDALADQAELYYHVADKHVVVAAQRDAAKLRFEEATAELDQQLRSKADAEEERVTEASLKQRISTAPKIKELRRRYLDLSTEADSWWALKEAFQQRSKMLGELVAMHVSQFRALSLDRGAHNALADGIREQAGRVRAARRG